MDKTIWMAMAAAVLVSACTASSGMFAGTRVDRLDPNNQGISGPRNDMETQPAMSALRRTNEPQPQ